MQENEFEKQVKEMMEGFKPIPSDAAWENISRKLEKERPRRRPFVFLLAFGVIIAVGIGYYFTKEKAKFQSTKRILCIFSQIPFVNCKWLIVNCQMNS